MQTCLLLSVALSCAWLAMTSGAAVVAGSSHDDKCHGLNCPMYTVLNKTSTWELRRYNAVKWAATTAEDANYDSVRSEMFQMLFQYISGKNADNKKIPMTAPVLTTITHGQGPTCASTFTMHFMVPDNQQASPIAPTDPKVFIATTPAQDVYVRAFGGFAKDQDYVSNLDSLSQDVSKAGFQFEDTYFYEAGYDGPYQFLNRHNEVWLVKKQ